MKKYLSIAAIAVLTLGFSISLAYTDGEPPLSEVPFKMLTYNQFRLLNDQNQVAYMQDVREMLVDLYNQGVDISSLLEKLSETFGAKWANFLASANQVNAAGEPSWCNQYQFSFGEDNLICVQRNGSAIKICHGTTPSQYANLCPQQFGRDRLAVQEKIGNQTTPGVLNKDIVDFNKQADSIEKSTAAKKAAQEAKAAEQAKATQAAQAAQAGQAGSTANQTAQPISSGKINDVRPLYPSTGNADTNQDKNKKFRCIYAGFTIYGKDCKPEERYIDPATHEVYTCTAPSDATKQDYGIIAPAKIDKRKTILCNPLFFGTTDPKSGSKKGEPICVARGKNATRDCLKAATSNKGSLDAAVAFAKKDKQKYEELEKTMNNLCTEDSAATKGMSASSKKDLQATCKSYRTRFEAYKEKCGADCSASRGGGIGSK